MSEVSYSFGRSLKASDYDGIPDVDHVEPGADDEGLVGVLVPVLPVITRIVNVVVVHKSFLFIFFRAVCREAACEFGFRGLSSTNFVFCVFREQF